MCFLKKESEILPKDVLKRLKKDFEDIDEMNKIKRELEVIFQRQWNVGSAQLVRSVLYLIQGDVIKVNDYKTILDPRDIISEAEHKSNGKYNYFNDKI